MRNLRYLIAAALVMMIILFASGCTSNRESVPDSLPNHSNEQPHSDGDQLDVDRQRPDSSDDGSQDPIDKEGEPVESDQALNPNNGKAKEQNNLEISAVDPSNPEKGQNDNHPTENPKGKPESSTSTPFNAANPMVLGLTIGSSKEYALSQHGHPLESFVMDDPFDPITVYRYKHFLIGFNTQEKVEFIDITSSEIDPGLNGLHLEDSVKDATRLLGDPDINTQYVVSYQSDHAILKLDIDPNTEKINSIKLFSTR